ncbi:MAG TPA: CrcB family protein [Mycobacteriales bacterium]|nr:CrcB family protein [Mycobacteriales bacterium]
MPVRTQALRALVMQLPIDPDLDVPFDRHDRRRIVILVAAGGAVGSLARAAVAIATPVAAHGWPTATLTVNVVGSALLAILLATLHERAVAAWWARPLLGTGFCGGFTTFSTFAVEFTTRTAQSHAPLAFGYVVASVVLSLAAAVLGIVVVRVGVRLTDRSAWHRRLRHATASRTSMADEEST